VRRSVVQLETRDREDMRRSRIEDERVVEGDPRDRPALGPEPTGGRQFGSVESVECRGDLGVASLDGDRLRYPC
jgi:hypothetical protein